GFRPALRPHAWWPPDSCRLLVEGAVRGWRIGWRRGLMAIEHRTDDAGHEERHRDEREVGPVVAAVPEPRGHAAGACGGLGRGEGEGHRGEQAAGPHTMYTAR